jgi:hypothetical protein
MQRILYISTARDGFDEAALDGILRSSRRNNAAVGVTGLLVVGGRRFLQVLEGPEDAVASVFERISRDPRHFAVVRLSRKTIETRTFGEWAMGYRSARKIDADGQQRDLRAIVEHLVEPIDDALLRAEFTEFATLHAAA